MTAAQPRRSRPWYCNDRLTDDYVRVHAEGGDLMMLKSLKILRAIVVNIGIVAIAMYALLEGADATIIGGIGLFSLAAYNGVEIADYGALTQAIVEVSQESDDTND
jgi:hypothetical protein